MSLAEAKPNSDVVVLDESEVAYLRFTCDLYAERESPLGGPDEFDTKLLSQAARALVSRGLADSATYRPNRELVRRMLIVGQPDARIVFVRASRRSNERLLDAYQRAGAVIRYRHADQRYELGAPEEINDVLQLLSQSLTPRRASGDFVDVSLGPTEYFAFSLLAGALNAERKRKRSAPSSVRRRPDTTKPPPARPETEWPARAETERPAKTETERPAKTETEKPAKTETERPAKTETSRPSSRSRPRSRRPSSAPAEDRRSVAALLKRLPPELSDGAQVPSEEDWQRALDSLERKDLAERSKGHFVLRPYFHDLAVGLATQRRHVVTRLDFTADDWIVRDGTFVSVPGSLFCLRAVRNRGIQIRELDEPGLLAELRRIVEPIGDSERIEYV